MKKNKLLGLGIVSAIAASLCCIAPVFALIAGVSGVASTFSWLEPIRPYLMGLTILVLGFAWYQKFKRKSEVDCGCDIDAKPKFHQSKTFLSLVTVFALVTLTFPYYSNIFYPDNKKEVIIIEEANIETSEFTIVGMTCLGCEEHVNHEVNQLNGIISSTVSYENGNAIIKFDQTKTTKTEIEKAINSTGYNVTGIKTK